MSSDITEIYIYKKKFDESPKVIKSFVDQLLWLVADIQSDVNVHPAYFT